jgi:hypothetical protein
LYALRAFEAAARHSSFTRAAEELSITQSAVSRHIRRWKSISPAAVSSQRTQPATDRIGAMLLPGIREGLPRWSAPATPCAPKTTSCA